MEINIPLDKAIGTTCSIICFVFLRKPLVKAINGILQIPRNLWEAKEFLVKLYGIALLPHSIILSLKGFPAYESFYNGPDQVDVDGKDLFYHFLACISIAVLFLGTVVACFGTPKIKDE